LGVDIRRKVARSGNYRILAARLAVFTQEKAASVSSGLSKHAVLLDKQVLSGF